MVAVGEEWGDRGLVVAADEEARGAGRERPAGVVAAVDPVEDGRGVEAVVGDGLRRWARAAAAVSAETQRAEYMQKYVRSLIGNFIGNAGGLVDWRRPSPAPILYIYICIYIYASTVSSIGGGRRPTDAAAGKACGRDGRLPGAWPGHVGEPCLASHRRACLVSHPRRYLASHPRRYPASHPRWYLHVPDWLVWPDRFAFMRLAPQVVLYVLYIYIYIYIYIYMYECMYECLYVCI